LRPELSLAWWAIMSSFRNSLGVSIHTVFLGKE
jgi:hypothetical protein